VVVLEIPWDLWEKAPSQERAAARHLAEVEGCQKLAKETGCRRFRIHEERVTTTEKDTGKVVSDFWQLHIDPIKDII
jgi:hypothetical protein